MLGLGRGTGKPRYVANRFIPKELESEGFLLKYIFRGLGHASRRRALGRH